MVQQGKDLKDMSVLELKGRVYDLSAVRNGIELQIQETNQLIAELNKPKEEPKTE